MVDAVVSFVVQRLGDFLSDFLSEQVIFPQAVRGEVHSLRSKLEWMLCFLKDAEEKQVENRCIRKWVSDITDVAYDAEDTIDKFILKVEEGGLPKKKGFEACLRNFSRIYKQADLYGLGKEIEELKKRLDEIIRNKEDFNIESIGVAGKGTSSMNERFKQQRRETPYENEGENVVGFKEDIELLKYELLKETPHRRVISIVGMGGLGKTTIARKLYNSSSVKDKFERKAWVSVSKDYNIQDLLRRIIKSFKMPNNKEDLLEVLEKMEKEDLECHLQELLKESRYLVVIDDVWDTDAWESLRRALPDNNKGSRVIITTRKKDVAESTFGDRKYVHNLPFLREEESLKLFCKKAFPDYGGVDDKTSYCPARSENLARDMVKKCNGLPLAIVVWGGLLSRKYPDEWTTQRHLWRRVSGGNIENRDSTNVSQILALSFNDLPYHLKSCFLYLGLFPEDFEIDAEKLIRLWVAEGFIQQGEEALEEIAAEYLNELIDRNLIQVAHRSWRRIRKCRVHDLLRDFAIEKSKELNFLHVYDGNDNSAPPPSKRRRLASHSGGLKRFDSFDHSSNLHLRTLLFFDLKTEFPEITKLESLYTKKRLLRVLDLDKITIYPTEQIRLPDTIGKLIHLRYLALSGTNINELPSSIGNLQALQTLECRYYFEKPVILPDNISNAKQLRHLIGYFKWPFRVQNLTNLQTLNCVNVDDKMEFNPLEDLINLRELQVYFNGKSKEFTLKSIGRLRSLQTLVLWTTGRLPSLQPLYHCQHLLQLKLYGKIVKLPEMHILLPNLKYLYLYGIGMQKDPMPSLEKLPKLTILELDDYKGEKLACTAKGFPQLEILKLFSCLVKELQLDEGAMPVLRGLDLGGREVSIPERLRSIPPPKNWEVLTRWNDWPY